MIAWIYGSGFPKSHNIGKAVDKIEGNEREYIGKNPDARPNSEHTNKILSGAVSHPDITKGSSPWEGWGTALKPALEPITLARKPLSEKTIAKNVLKWGTGGLNIDGCRVGTETIKGQKAGQGFNNVKGFGVNTKQGEEQAKEYTSTDTQGRFPANLILTYPENEYILSESITNEQREKALKWIYENAQHTMQNMQETSIQDTERPEKV
jgi:site-specific DNA-methyltransferase (adenine-specific)